MRCKSQTKDGYRCKNKVCSSCTKYCHVHTHGVSKTRMTRRKPSKKRSRKAPRRKTLSQMRKMSENSFFNYLDKLDTEGTSSAMELRQRALDDILERVPDSVLNRVVKKK